MRGHQLAGTSLTRERIKDDFYATPESAVKAILAVEEIIYPAWEPACGAGHISKLLSSALLWSSDLIDRGYGQSPVDFVAGDVPDGMVHIPQTIITNPPFNLFTEFAQRAVHVAQTKVILFGKLQALEGIKRATFLQQSPLRTVYVFKKRQNPLRNGQAVDENGKPWASTMAFAWFVWEIGYTGKPQIEWL